MTTTFALRIETDLLGPRQLPADALYGIHTLRASENFPVSRALTGHYPDLVRALAMVKLAAARANRDLGVLAPVHHDAIAGACAQLLEGRHHDAFIVGMIQGGAGTSTNMNANEVIANLGLIALGRRPGDYADLHPNDHVNRSQSTNDVYPTALRIALMLAVRPVEDELSRLVQAFRARARDFASVLKLGRTQLQDAVPMTLGAEFAGFGSGVEQDLRHLRAAVAELAAVNLGGTAIGTGINAHEGYGACARAHLAEISGYPVRAADDLIEASSDMGALVAVSAALRRVALRLSKIGNDLRLLSSGPRAGLGEIHLPPVQAGSSIMPGKINPVIPEMVSQIAYQVIGHDLSVTMAAEAGQLQLNAMEPLIGHALLESLRLLAAGVSVLRLRCVDGIRADPDRCRAHLEASTAMCTPLVPLIGYARASGLAQRALAENRPLADLVVGEGLMSAADYAALERAACAL